MDNGMMDLMAMFRKVPDVSEMQYELPMNNGDFWGKHGQDASKMMTPEEIQMGLASEDPHKQAMATAAIAKLVRLRGEMDAPEVTRARYNEIRNAHMPKENQPRYTPSDWEAKRWFLR